MSYLIDTNIISEVRKGDRCDPNVFAWYASIAEEELFLSTLVLGEIRNGGATLHSQLKPRAALAGMSLSDYLLSEIRQVAERPTIDELRARLRGRTETAPSVPPAEAVREERDRM